MLNNIKNGSHHTLRATIKTEYADLQENLSHIDESVAELNKLKINLLKKTDTDLSPVKELHDDIVSSINRVYKTKIMNAPYELEDEMQKNCDTDSVSHWARDVDWVTDKRTEICAYISANQITHNKKPTQKSKKHISIKGTSHSVPQGDSLANIVNVRAHYIALQATDSALQVLVATALNKTHNIDEAYMKSFQYQLHQLKHNNAYNQLVLDDVVHDKLQNDISGMWDHVKQAASDGAEAVKNAAKSAAKKAGEAAKSAAATATEAAKAKPARTGSLG